jgi:hypothetical protein
MYKTNNNDNILFYKIKSSPAIYNAGFKQDNILFLSSQYYPQNDLNSIPYHYSRRKFANLDFVKIPTNMSRIDIYFKNITTKLEENNIYINNHNYSEIILSLENDLLFQFISKKEFYRNIESLKQIFTSSKVKFNIISNFQDISNQIPFPFNYYYLYQKEIFQSIINNHL